MEKKLLVSQGLSSKSSENIEKSEICAILSYNFLGLVTKSYKKADLKSAIIVVDP